MTPTTTPRPPGPIPAYTRSIVAAWQGLTEAIIARDLADEDSRDFAHGQIEAYATMLTALTGRSRAQILAAGYKRAERNAA